MDTTTSDEKVSRCPGPEPHPAGVGPMLPGDEITGGVQGIAEFGVTIGPRPA